MRDYSCAFVKGQILDVLSWDSLAEVLWTQDRGSQLLLLRKVWIGAQR